MNTSPSICNLTAALAVAQGEMKFAVKGSANTFFKSKYADLAAVWDACRAPLAKNGLSIIQNVNTMGGEVLVETILFHSSGEWNTSTLAVPIVGTATPQSIGSAITYARRYALAATVGLAQDDDDGNSSSGKDEHPVAPHPVKMSEEAYANHRAAIEGASGTNVATLKAIWIAARKAAEGDEEAILSLTAIKDAVKEGLGAK